jgi:hypothetical protein
MNFITGKHLSRRTFLRGTGASFALPFMDAMVPALKPSRHPADGFTRLVCIEESHGAAGGNLWGESQYLFAPKTIGRNFDIGANSQLRGIADYRDYVTIVSNTDCRMAEPFKSEEVGGDHDRSTAVFLTQSHPLQTQQNIFLGKSIDQVHAERFGQETVLPSLELTTERVDTGGGCAYNYHCAYKTTLAWKSPSEPLPTIREPRMVFDQLFGAGDTNDDRLARRRQNKSLLDFVAQNIAELKRELSATDRVALDQYTTFIRELERRIQLVEQQNTSGDERSMPDAPSGVPDRWEEHMELMFDLQVIALQGDITRSISFKTGFDLSNLVMPDSGTNKSFHSLSHHGNQPASILEFNMINTYRLGRMAYFLDKLKNTMDGDAPLLDKMAIIWGSPMGDPNLHAHRRCPLVLFGKANGLLEGNMHLRTPEGTPMSNVFVSLMQGIGHDGFERFGDSTGAFPLYVPRGSSAAEAGQ